MVEQQAEHTRYVALGDSFTEGVGDPDPSLPNGVRGWADRVAEQLALADPRTEYANLAIRGRKLVEVVDEQIEPAVAMAPTLVTLYAGGNDILRPRVDIDALMARYDDAVGRLRATGASVLLFTGFDTVASRFFSVNRGRTAIYNELVREVADRHGATLVDYWRFEEYDDPRMWDVDRLHMSTRGHITMAGRVLDTLRHEHTLRQDPLPALVPVRRLDAVRANVRWTREYVGPWVMRRIRRTSSGKYLEPRRPVPSPLAVTPIAG
ncbi:SGNH/GDSL hydrolase family protein [Tersicoccus sp. MR15.9]|uniref:SGNH/GDSL hydrolase family protein n=1 Tax=Tersicoccus mangrovi TaxID=3121635 RepID=UPI002FE5C556